MGAPPRKRQAVPRTQRDARYGSGSLFKNADARGETWIAKWRDGGRQVQRSVGPVRCKTHPDGLTRAEAEAAFDRIRAQVAVDRGAERQAEARQAAEKRRRNLQQSARL